MNVNVAMPMPTPKANVLMITHWAIVIDTQLSKVNLKLSLTRSKIKN